VAWCRTRRQRRQRRQRLIYACSYLWGPGHGERNDRGAIEGQTWEGPEPVPVKCQLCPVTNSTTSTIEPQSDRSLSPCSALQPLHARGKSYELRATICLAAVVCGLWSVVMFVYLMRASPRVGNDFVLVQARKLLSTLAPAPAPSSKLQAPSSQLHSSHLLSFLYSQPEVIFCSLTD
jgi:hypothetical protein